MKRDLKKGLMVVIAQMCVIAGFAATPTISNETAKQRYPWNGLVDITCTVSGINGTTNGLKFALAAVMPDSGEVRKISQFWVVQNGTNSTDKMVHANGDYRLVWDAQLDLGAVVYSNMVMRVTVVNLHDKVQLWKGGPYWANTNIGAENPEDCGYYFWWGDTVGYKRENNTWVATDGLSSNYSFDISNTPTYGKDIDTLERWGWITSEALSLWKDAAHVQWGGGWRMPTQWELNDLISKCSWTWTTMNGVQGYLVSGTGDYASNSIFLPCAGYGLGTSLDYAGSRGAIWSSTRNWGDNFRASYLHFGSGYFHSYVEARCYGIPIRPVEGSIE